MPKYFKLFNGNKFLVDEKGAFLKEGGEMTPAPSDATEFVEKTDAELMDEATKSLMATVTGAIEKQASEVVKSIDLPAQFAKAVSDGIKSVVETKGNKTVSFMPGFEGDVNGTETLSIDEVKSGLKSVKGARNKSFEFTAKALSELTSLTGELPEEDRQPGVTTLAKEDLYIMDLVAKRTTNSKTVTYVEVLSETGAPATVAEMAAFPEKDYNFVVRSATVYKVAVMTKASQEVLEDTGELVSIVQSELKGDLDRKVDAKLLSATGVNDIIGIASIAPGFTGGALAGQVATPSRVDVLQAGLTEVRVNGFGKFKANAIMLNPVDVALLKLEKGSDGHYIMPPFTSSDRLTVSGVRVVENDNMTPGTFIIGDFTRFYVYIRRGASLQVATENKDDFEKELITMRLAMRLASFVKVNENAAFVQGDFATAIGILAI